MYLTFYLFFSLNQRPEIVEDFVRNFLVKMGMMRTLDCFQTEWWVCNVYVVVLSWTIKTNCLNCKLLGPQKYSTSRADFNAVIAIRVDLNLWQLMYENAYRATRRTVATQQTFFTS